MTSKLFLVSMIGTALLTMTAYADCPDLSGQYLCQGQKTIIQQTPISGGVDYKVESDFDAANPQSFFTQEYIADGKAEDGQALSEEDGGTPKTECTSSGFKSSVGYLYWGLNPVYESTTYEKQKNGDIEVVEWRYQGITGAVPGIPARNSYTCTKAQ